MGQPNIIISWDLDVGLGRVKFKKFTSGLCSSCFILHDLSSDRRKTGQFLSSNLTKIVRKELFVCSMQKKKKKKKTTGKPTDPPENQPVYRKTPFIPATTTTTSITT